MKKDGFGYRLGSMSDHALGNAIDIDAAHNPQINAASWAAIEAYVGSSMAHASRRSLWKTDPKRLHDHIRKLSESFVAKLAAAVSARMKGPPAHDDAAALIQVVESDQQLQRIGAGFVRKYRRGFFALPWELVNDLHDTGFLWGATFTTVDLHHFELGSGEGA